MDEQKLLFFDIEVFSHNAFVVFKDANKKLLKVFHNNFTKLAEFIKGKTLIGFNNYWYDDKILIYMLDQKPVHMIKQLNDKIIAGENVNFLRNKDFESLDVFQQIDVSRPSLKKIQGNLGRLILESNVPFTIDRPLTNEEFNDVLDYCIYDVDTTITIFKKRIKSYFKPKFQLIDMLGKPSAIKWNTTTISANLLLKNPLPKWHNTKVPEEFLDLVPEEVKNLWFEKDKGAVTIENFNNTIQFGFGGLHGAHKEIKKAENVILLDVKSMYPHIILLLNALGHATEKYKAILDQRLKIKNVDKVLSDALKLILNSVYGNLNNKYSPLYNPKAALSVCIYGQIALYELCKKIAPFCTIININTDGVAFVPHDTAYNLAYKEWEKEFNLELEQKNYDLFVQKDVNNYIAVTNDYLECKGGDVNRYKEDALFKNNNARILDIALVDFLIHGKDVITTLEENLDKPALFQYILKAGNTYKGTSDQTGQLLETKVNRVFAAKKEGLCLYKQRHDSGLVRYADAPTKMFLWNHDTKDIDNFQDVIDLTHYYEIIKKRLERWI